MDKSKVCAFLAMTLIESIKALFVSVITSLSHLWLPKLPLTPPLDLSPPIISPLSQQGQPQSSATMDLESQFPLPQQPQSPAINLESPQVVNVVVPKQGLEWQNIIMTFCFTSALQIALQFAQPQSKISVSFCLLSFAILLIFSTLWVSPIIGSKFPRASKAMEKVVILLAATAFFFSIAIPFPLSLRCATWTIYVICLLTVVTCNCFY